MDGIGWQKRVRVSRKCYPKVTLAGGYGAEEAGL